MKIRIRTNKLFEVTKALRQHVEQLLGLVLGRFGTRIGQVTVSFRDEGKVKCCQIDVDLQPRKLRVEDTHGDPFSAVKHAADRALSSIDRALEHERALAVEVISAPPPRPRRR